MSTTDEQRLREQFDKYASVSLLSCDGYTAIAVDAAWQGWQACAAQQAPTPAAVGEPLREAARQLMLTIENEAHPREEIDLSTVWNVCSAFYRGEPAAPVDAPKYIALRAKGVLDADDNLDAWDTPPYDIATRHVEALNERDPSSAWRLARLWRLACLYVLADEAAASVDARDALTELRNIAEAKRFERDRFDNDTAFADWAQSRARYTLARQAAAPVEGEKT